MCFLKIKMKSIHNVVMVISSFLAKASSVLANSSIILAQVVLAAAMVVGITQVFARYFFRSSLMWSEESMRYMLIWLVFLILPIGIKQGKHIALDVFIQMVRPPVRKGINVLSYFLYTLFFSLLFIDSIKLLSALRFQTASSFPIIPIRYIYAIVPITLGLVLFYCVELIVKELSRKGESLR